MTNQVYIVCIEAEAAEMKLQFTAGRAGQVIIRVAYAKWCGRGLLWYKSRGTHSMLYSIKVQTRPAHDCKAAAHKHSQPDDSSGITH